MAVKKRKYKADTIRAAFRDRHVGVESEDGEQRLFCPICEDPRRSKSPSASINADGGMWNCLTGNHGGQITDLVADLTKNNGFDIRAARMKGQHMDPDYKASTNERLNAARGKGVGVTPLPDEDQIEKWVEALLSNKPKLTALMEQRGFERSTVVDWQLGFDGDRYTIPIREADGELVNVRRYRLNAGTSDKMLNLPGHGAAHIYRPDILDENKDIVITEGETDCILLNQYGVPAVTHTAGAGTFKPQWGSQFIDKNVWICYDVDDAGRKGAAKVKGILETFAENVFVMQLPLQAKGADVTDYLHKEGHTEREFRELMGDAMDDAGVNRIATPVATTGEKMSLNESMAQANQSKTVELTVSVAGKDSEPYTAPKRFTVTCDQSKGAVCQVCPIMAKGGQAEIELRPDDEQVFRFIETTEQRRKTLMKEVSGARCTDRAEFEIDENYHVEQLLIQPSVDDRTDDETQQPIKRTAFSISTHSSDVNRKVRMVGKNTPDPKTGKLKFMAFVNEPVEMDIDRFKLTPDLKERLRVFQPGRDQGPLSKSLEIAADMAQNVTHIYGRDLVHVAYDLVWHSVISFKVYDQVVQKGWNEAMIVGDTRTGKSEIGVQLMKHYASGTMQSCEGMSFPGLVGGVQQIDGRWHMTWGVIPMNDRRLVILDEVSGLKEAGVIEQMSSIRSSGVAQVTKIASEETSARTRLVWITNPADGSMLADNPLAGMGAMRTVVPNAEDVARFDFVIATAKGDVESSLINVGFAERHAPQYSTEDCEALVKWAWSLTRNDVIVSKAAAKAAVEAALDMGGRYMNDPPLIQSENVRFKILRIAAALAARTFSINDDDKLEVLQEHVHDAVRFLDMIYDQDSMGYGRASRKMIAQAAQAREKKQLVRTYLSEHEDDVLFTLKLVGGKNFRQRDFVDFGSMEPTAAKAVTKQLTSWGVVKLKNRGELSMEPVLLEVLREIEDDDE
jgi:5S rRNA maturation endonuclease (ribonuclease M5)